MLNPIKKKKTQSILTLPRAPARVASTDAPGSTQDVKRGLNKERNWEYWWVKEESRLREWSSPENNRTPGVDPRAE